ncbi:MAG: acetyltransferase [Planctomycetota bacterium]
MGLIDPSEAIMIIVGASDHGQVVLDILRSQASPPRVLGFLDYGVAGSYVGRSVAGVLVLDTLQNAHRYREQVSGAVPAAGDCAVREAIAADLERAGIPMLVAVHPTAHVSESATLGPGAVVCAGAIVGVGARVGRAAIVNTGAIVDHHVRVGDYAHVAPRATLAGNVRVGERTWVGLGASVRQGILIGPDAMIGMGAVVIRDVEAGQTVAGVPARPIERQRCREGEMDLA